MEMETHLWNDARMKKMWTLISLLLLLACKVEQDGDMRRISLEFSLPETKVSLPGDRTYFQWEDGDGVSIFNNVDQNIAYCQVSAGAGSVNVPAAATMLYSVYPQVTSSRGPASVSVSVPSSQTQVSGGVFPSHNFPFTAIASANGASARLIFRPLAAALALNIYGGTGSIKAVRVTPLSNSGFAGTAELDLTRSDVTFSNAGGAAESVTLQLTEPVAMGTKPETPDDKRTFPGQIYVCLARQQYTSLRFDIDTGSTTWRLITSDSYVFDCEENDIVLTNINLEKGTVSIDGVSGEAFDEGVTLEKIQGGFSELIVNDDTENVDHIPDFSRVGYKYGDEAIPSPAVAATIDIASISTALNNRTAQDTTDYIQQVLDRVGNNGGGAVLLKNGTYNVSRILFLDHSNTVLRGESESGTILHSTTKNQAPIVYMGASVAKQSGDVESESLTFVAGRRVGITKLTAMGNTGSSSFGSVIIKTYTPKFPGKTFSSASDIIEDYVPLGRLYVEVANPNLFKTGDQVRIYRQPTESWLDDIGMTRIASNGRESVGSPVNQWTVAGYTFSWTRVVTDVRGNRIYLDAPVAQSLEKRYGGGRLEKYSQARVTGCGVEKLSFNCDYDTSVIYNGNQVDECHAWQAVLVRAAEHCWVRNVTTRHMGYALADMGNSARCITVQNCTSLSPISAIQGARRYAYCLSTGAELCLVKDCSCDEDRHSFVTNGPSLGPNVFTNCVSTHGHAAIGPHWGWATTTLYDCIQADTGFEAQDGGNQGTGHGWRGINTVFWNVYSSEYIVSQSVWGTCPSCGKQWNRTEICSQCGAIVIPSGRNYVIGSIGKKTAHTVYWDKDYYGNATTDYFVSLYGWGSNEENRPDGSWYPARSYNATGGQQITLPIDTPVSWWPRFTINQFSNPLSLYQCQLEDRHARGVFLNVL